MIEPRVANVPRYATTAGDDAIELAAAAGIFLDDWQQHVLRLALGETEQGKWTTPEVGLLCARQNGKSELLIARALAELFLFGPQAKDPDVMFSAHEFKTGRQIFRRTCNIIEASPSLQRHACCSWRARRVQVEGSRRSSSFSMRRKTSRRTRWTR